MVVSPFTRRSLVLIPLLLASVTAAVVSTFYLNNDADVAVEEPLLPWRTTAAHLRANGDYLCRHWELAPQACSRKIKSESAKVLVEIRKVGFLPRTDEVTANFVARLFLEAEARFGVSRPILLAVTAVESSFRHDALSDKGARGMLQIQPATAEHLWPYFQRRLDDEDPLHEMDPILMADDPRLSVLLGAYYLSRLTRDFDNQVEHALASYNMGPARFRERLKVLNGELGRDSRAYVEKVRTVLSRLETRT